MKPHCAAALALAARPGTGGRVAAQHLPPAPRPAQKTTTAAIPTTAARPTMCPLGARALGRSATRTTLRNRRRRSGRNRAIRSEKIKKNRVWSGPKIRKKVPIPMSRAPTMAIPKYPPSTRPFASRQMMFPPPPHRKGRGHSDRLNDSKMTEVICRRRTDRRRSVRYRTSSTI